MQDRKEIKPMKPIHMYPIILKKLQTGGEMVITKPQSKTSKPKTTNQLIMTEPKAWASKYIFYLALETQQMQHEVKSLVESYSTPRVLRLKRAGGNREREMISVRMIEKLSSGHWSYCKLYNKVCICFATYADNTVQQPWIFGETAEEYP